MQRVDGLWQRIAAHRIGDDEAAFAQRVARACGLASDESREAIDEYRRFVFLACQGEEVTPSKIVDAVWHEHLLHTRDYWETFCPRVLGAPLHHSPGMGNAEDEGRHALQYARTLRAYRMHFGEPPQRWWPQRELASKLATAPASHASAARARPASRRDVATFALLAGLPALTLAAARPANPLDWAGPEFLALYLGLMLTVLIVTPLWRRWLRSRGGPIRDPGSLSTLEAAYLAGGESRAMDAGLAALHHRGVLRWDAHRRRFVRHRSGEQLDPPLRELGGLFDGADVGTALKRGRAVVTPVLRTLEQRGLHESRSQARRIATLAALPAFALLLFGLAKIAVGVARERPVTTLVVLCVVVALYALAIFAGAAKPTRAGREALSRTRAAAHATKNGRFDDMGLAVALGGTALLSGTALAGYHELRAPRSDSSGSDSSSSGGSTDSSSSDSGGSSCGSSCGGCGGGGGD